MFWVCVALYLEQELFTLLYYPLHSSFCHFVNKGSLSIGCT